MEYIRKNQSEEYEASEFNRFTWWLDTAQKGIKELINRPIWNIQNRGREGGKTRSSIGVIQDGVKGSNIQ